MTESVLALLTLFAGGREAAEKQFLWSPLAQLTITCDLRGYARREIWHGGIDFKARGAVVYAAAKGRIIKAVDGKANDFRAWSYGNEVRILHPNGYVTIYAHLKKGTLRVREGQRIVAGTILGISGNSGRATAPHLHFEVRDPNGKRVDPFGRHQETIYSCRPSLSPDDPECGLKHLWTICPPLALEPSFRKP